MNYVTVTLSKQSLIRLEMSEGHIPEDDYQQVVQALEIIKLEEEYDRTPSGLTPWGQTKEEFWDILLK